MPENNTTDLVRRGDVADLTKDDLTRFFSIAKSLALSGRFPDATTGDEAFAKILLGRDLGMSPTQSMTGIHIVEGRPQIAGVSLAAFVRKSEDYDYEIIELDGDNEDEEKQRCTLRFTRYGEPLVPDITYSLKNARQLKSFKINQGPWSTARRNMLFWRAMSDGVKIHCPDLMGGVPVYTEGDVFESTATDITAPVGSGEAQGIDLGPNVEAIIERATKLGHFGLSNRASLEIALDQRKPEVVERWLVDSKAELDRFEAAAKESSTDEPVDAEVVPEDDGPVGVTGIPGTGSDVMDADSDAVQRHRLAALKKLRQDESLTTDNKLQLDEEIKHVEGLLS